MRRSAVVRTLGGNRGAALMVMVVVIFLVLAFLGTWILNETTTFVTGATLRARAQQAYYLAQSGLEWARLEVRSRADLDGDGTVGQIASRDGSVRHPFGGGSIWVEAVLAGSSLTLTAHGAYQEITRSIRSIEQSPWQ